MCSQLAYQEESMLRVASFLASLRKFVHQKRGEVRFTSCFALQKKELIKNVPQLSLWHIVQLWLNQLTHSRLTPKWIRCKLNSKMPPHTLFCRFFLAQDFISRPLRSSPNHSCHYKLFSFNTKVKGPLPTHAVIVRCVNAFYFNRLFFGIKFTTCHDN